MRKWVDCEGYSQNLRIYRTNNNFSILVFGQAGLCLNFRACIDKVIINFILFYQFQWTFPHAGYWVADCIDNFSFAKGT